MRVLRRIFTNIYDNDLWGHGSGPGSLPENVGSYVEILNWLIEEFKATSVLDVGCGNWMFSSMVNYHTVDYLGVDIVSSVIEENVKKYKKDNISFECRDFTEYVLPKKFDLVVIKDVLQHLSYHNCNKILSNIKYKLLVITNDFTDENSDCLDGNHRPLNVTLEPFGLKSLYEFTFDSYPLKKHTVVIHE